MDIRQALLRGGNLWESSVLWKSAPSPPPAPDYAGAASATAAGNKENTIAAQQGSMVNQQTPYGNLNYNQTGSWDSTGNPKYTASIDLSPTGQQLLDYAQKSQLGMGALQSGATQNLQNAFAQPFDQQSVNDIYNKSYDLNKARLDPQWSQNEEMQKSELQNQGIMQGSQAYDNAMRTFNQGKNDAYQQAQQAAIATMPTTFQLGTAARSQPLNELNALMTGSQVTNPQFGQTPQQQAVPGPNYLGAAQAQGQYNQGLYNSEVGQANSFNSGLMGLGGAIGSGLITRYSDIRLKSNIKRIGTHKLGIGIYEYDIFGARETGVMAQEVLQVKPDAVIHTTGFMRVNYDAL
jgi:hypothetical protein